MISKLEILPNEIFLNILSYLSWDEILISLWSLNKRINFIICSMFSINKSGIIFNQPGLSYKKSSSTLFPLIFNSLTLCTSIKYIHLNGINSNSYDLIDKFIFNNDKIIRFCNLKCLKISRFLLSQSLIERLSFLIQYQLDKLILSFDEEDFEFFEPRPGPYRATYSRGGAYI